MTAHNPKAPSHLGKPGKSLWNEIVEQWDLRPDELRILDSACVAADMESEFLTAWIDEGRPYTSKGSMGQLIEHPLIGSIDKQAKSKAAHLKQLKLPDDGADSAGERSSSARAAANARWSRRGA